MATIQVDILGTKQMAARLQQLGKTAAEAIGAALYREAEAIMAKSLAIVPVDLGPLRASGHVQAPVILPNGATVTIGYGGPAAPYAIYIHEGTGPAVGRKPFFPSKAFAEAMEEWGQRHGFPEGSGWAIAISIGKKGLQPRKYLERPLLEAAPGMGHRIAEAMEKELAKVAT